jgi:MYXO-CTERM domain-containing protein
MRLYLALGLSLSVTLPCVAELVNIEYTSTDLGRGRWQYRYDVTNNALVCRVEAFVIWFDLGSCAQLSLRTEAPLSTTWRELIAQPDPMLRNDGFYDVLSLTGGIGVGESLGDFSVAFDWAGEGTPGPQVFEIVTPITYEPIFSGTTMPEPAVLGLLGLLLLLRRRR